MNTAVCKAAIKAALLLNITSKGMTPTSDQVADADATAGAIADAATALVSSASLTYTAGLVAPSGGGPVTGDMTTVVIS